MNNAIKTDAATHIYNYICK